jgi:hypothetical protein
LGTAIMIAVITGTLFFVAGARIFHVLVLAATGLLTALLLIASGGYRMDRITSFLSAEDDPLGVGMHTLQLLVAFGSGGVSGLGLGPVQAKTDVQNIRGRDRGALYFRMFFAEVRDRVVGSGRLDAATLDAASALLDDPNYWTQCWMMTAVWVRKPPA